jgi:ApaG protein
VNSLHPFLELPGLSVTVDDVIYQQDASTPVDRPHCFVYFVTIHNGSEHPITIRGRKWVVTDSRGQITAVEGDGVVGQFPLIPPGGSFTYNSYHLLATASAVAEGSYIGTDALGRKVLVRIPKFTMTVPSQV